MKIEEYISTSEEETKKIAEDFSKKIKTGDVVVLNGLLGSGKTFFVKKVAEFFNLSNSSSPTFAIVNEYQGKIKIFHLDFYRINSIEELYDIGITDYLTDSTSVVFIEWGELFEEVLPKSRYEISFSINEDDSRKIIINKYE
ncbi:MAG: tRNA (adenosine(37)-N6)-threonylcarbamoyltransferase complex ATPase subunit type 1 TsaE [Ignavibacterium sp.]|nr:tRNA (adenosine(37)-N6)-threonylcarbamoyltransferase complex ATPase subunit type 1 TsaE [Ignavibacterium sp.]MCX7609959.1 tRNA (adenosine(37)-N6)-threonylcarbamoyltransferase complex ATPase subunit type 1 TsaE [Ignavibacterium sp.]MDW8374087.1 tRNA (adenosine(37)-N6)-threonylcarbamoyltransferase complex ATPase subunit type 1 TsaE [Ignavibacteriales bacterium]